MPKPATQREAVTYGQLARKWGVSVARIQQMVKEGKLPGVFEIPPVEGFGKVRKIPMESVKAAERNWSVGALGDRREVEDEAAGGAGDEATGGRPRHDGRLGK